MAIQLSKLNENSEHSVEATLNIEGQKYPVKVFYSGFSARKASQLRARIGEDQIVHYAEFLDVYVTRIEDLDGKPAFVNEDGTPAQLNADVFWGWSVENLTAIHDAISGEQNPDPQPQSEA